MSGLSPKDTHRAPTYIPSYLTPQLRGNIGTECHRIPMLSHGPCDHCVHPQQGGQKGTI